MLGQYLRRRRTSRPPLLNDPTQQQAPQDRPDTGPRTTPETLRQRTYVDGGPRRLRPGWSLRDEGFDLGFDGFVVSYAGGEVVVAVGSEADVVGSRSVLLPPGPDRTAVAGCVVVGEPVCGGDDGDVVGPSLPLVRVGVVGDPLDDRKVPPSGQCASAAAAFSSPGRSGPAQPQPRHAPR